MMQGNFYRELLTDETFLQGWCKTPSVLSPHRSKSLSAPQLLSWSYSDPDSSLSLVELVWFTSDELGGPYTWIQCSSKTLKHECRHAVKEVFNGSVQLDKFAWHMATINKKVIDLGRGNPYGFFFQEYVSAYWASGDSPEESFWRLWKGAGALNSLF